MKVEIESLKDLEKIVAEAKKWNINLVLIGGYAVRAYTRGYRYTKDMDFITNEIPWKLKSFLNALNYNVEEKKIIMAGKKSINGGYIDLHISLGEVFDISTGKKYPLSENTFKSAKTLDISGYYEESRKITVKAPVVALEDLIIMKLMTRNRNKDSVDIVSLLLDNGEKLDLKTVSQNCASAGLSRHISDNALELAGKIRTGIFRKPWLDYTGSELMQKDRKKLSKILIGLADKLKE